MDVLVLVHAVRHATVSVTMVAHFVTPAVAVQLAGLEPVARLVNFYKYINTKSISFISRMCKIYLQIYLLSLSAIKGNFITFVI